MNKEMCNGILRRRRVCHQKETPQKTENERLVSPSRKRSSTPVGFGRDFLSKNNVTNSTAFQVFSWSSSSWFLPVPWIEISIEGTALYWCYWRRNTWKGFHKSASRNVQTHLQSLEEVYSCTWGLHWMKCSLNELHFSEIKWFREHFTATTCNFSPVKNPTDWKCDLI